MRAVKTFTLVFLVCSGLFLYPDGGILSLIKIPKGPALTASALTRSGVEVRQELQSCLLALAGRDEISRLRRMGVRFSVLDKVANRKEFLLVSLEAPGALDSLRARGQAVAVEPRTAVFWTGTTGAAEAVPAGLPRKALSTRPVRVELRRAAVAVEPVAKAVAPDPLVETIVSLVSSSRLSSDVQSLQDFQTRFASTTNCEAAAEYLYGAFDALGLDEVRFEQFPFSAYTSRNVVAEKTGETYPDDIVVICGHYDSTSPAVSRLTLAPGADDNASGTVAVLEAARVLAAYPLDFTVRFIAFSAEEWGLFGSRAHAAAARQAGERIIGVINLDMIAYADAMPEDLQVIVNTASGWLADRFLAAASDYAGMGATKTVDASFIYSDHSPFWDNGYPALLAIEDDPLNNPYYHQTTDTLDRLNPTFFTDSTRAAVGLLAELAQPIRAGYPATPVGLTAAPVACSSLFNDLTAVRLAWDAVAGAAGYNIYRAAETHLNYIKINDIPVTSRQYLDDDVSAGGIYYYVVTAVDGAGLEGNRSREESVAFSIPATRGVTISGASFLRIWGFR
jgi:Peptidase family M28